MTNANQHIYHDKQKTMHFTAGAHFTAQHLLHNLATTECECLQ